MKRYGLIGFPLTHSWSAGYFTQKFSSEQLSDRAYELFPIKSIRDFPTLLSEHKDISGLNVTTPYKVSVLEYLDRLSVEAREAGAVNCIQFRENTGQIHLVGYNTDIYGFHLSLNPLLRSQHTRALILGTGGASKAVSYVLKKLGIEHSFV